MATADNCPDFEKCQADGLGAAIETKVVLNLQHFNRQKARINGMSLVSEKANPNHSFKPMKKDVVS